VLYGIVLFVSAAGVWCGSISLLGCCWMIRFLRVSSLSFTVLSDCVAVVAAVDDAAAAVAAVVDDAVDAVDDAVVLVDDADDDDDNNNGDR